MTDLFGNYQLDIKKAGLSLNGISPHAKILCQTIQREFSAYGQQQKDDRESAAKQIKRLEERIERLETADDR